MTLFIIRIGTNIKAGVFLGGGRGGDIRSFYECSQ